MGLIIEAKCIRYTRTARINHGLDENAVALATHIYGDINGIHGALTVLQTERTVQKRRE